MNRYIVGIDLGTTNCAMAFIDLKDKKNLQFRFMPSIN